MVSTRSWETLDVVARQAQAIYTRYDLLRDTSKKDTRGEGQ